MQRADLLEKTLMLGKIEGGKGEARGGDGWMASPTQWTWVWASPRMRIISFWKTHKFWETQACFHVCLCDFTLAYVMTNLDSILKSRHQVTNKSLYRPRYCFSSSHVWMWELDHKEGWTPKNWCFWTMVPEKTFESPLDWKVIKPVDPKGDQPWVVTGRTDAEAEVHCLMRRLTHWHRVWCWERLRAKGEEGGRGCDG